MSLLALDQFRERIGYNPWHFFGLASSLVPVTSSCNGLLQKYDWQNADSTSRSEIVTAIETAEARLIEYLGFAPAPHYLSETHPYPTWYARGEIRTLPVDSSGRYVGIRLKEGHIQQVGIEAHTLIDADAPVVYTDEDGDGLFETFSVTVSTTVTDPQEIAVYFTGADRLDGEPIGEAWRVQPVRVTISGGSATIRGKAWLLVRPILYEGARKPDHIDPSGVNIFVTDLAVYRRYVSTGGETVDDSQGVLEWESAPWPLWAFCCDSATSDVASYGRAVARVGIRDKEQGIVFPAQSVYDSTSGAWLASPQWGSLCRPPDRATIRYYAGADLGPDGQMQKKWQDIVARMAAAELAVRICTDNTSNHVLHRWQFDRARAAGANDEQYSLAPDDLDNPFGTREGHIYAWRQVKNLRRMGGILL